MLFAGAGKTWMLLALAQMVIFHQEDALVWLVAPTNQMARDLHAKASELFPTSSLLHLHIFQDESGPVDAGMQWLRS